MLSIGAMNNGIVIDHIPAGQAMNIYRYLRLGDLDCGVAIIKNAHSNKMGKKDIIKIENGLEVINLDVLGYIDCNITVNIIENEKIVEKKQLHLPKQLINIIKCQNPRCITSTENHLDQIFYLKDADTHLYRCKYCDESPGPGYSSC